MMNPRTKVPPRLRAKFSRKVSQLVREGYPQRQAVRIAFEELRAGKINSRRKRRRNFSFPVTGQRVQKIRRVRSIHPIRGIKRTGELVGVANGWLKVKWDNASRPHLVRRSEVKLISNPRRDVSSTFMPSPERRGPLSVPERHMLKIARDTLKMPHAIAAIMGGPTKEEAREILRRLKGRKRNPRKLRKRFRKAESPLRGHPHEEKRGRLAAGFGGAARAHAKMLKEGFWFGPEFHEKKREQYRKLRRRALTPLPGPKGKLPNAKRAPRAIANLSRKFQGRASGRVQQLAASSAAPLDLARLGKLRSLTLKNHHEARTPGMMLAADGKGKLWFVGGKFRRGHANPKAIHDYGPVEKVCYVTAKRHIGNGKTYEFVHTFGEDGGRLPHLHVDPEGYGRLHGGSYRITSAGIVN